MKITDPLFASTIKSTVQPVVGIAILDGEAMRISFANERMLQIWGKGSDIIGHSLPELFSEGEDEHFVKLVEKVLTTGQPCKSDEQSRVLMVDGNPREMYFSFLLQPFFNGDNEPRGVTVLTAELSYAEIAKRKNQESERQFRNVLLESPSIFLILKGYPELVITFGNEALFRSWDKTSDIIGKPILEVLPELKDQPFPRILEQVYKSGKAHYGTEEQAVVIKDGKPLQVFYNYVYQPILQPDGTVSGITVMANDVTDQVAARTIVHEQNRVLEMVTGGVPLSEALDFLIRSVERQSDDAMVGSIMLLSDDGSRLYFGGGPGMPRAFRETIDGGAIGPAAGSCGTAAYRKEPVVVSDISTDPLWVDYRKVAMESGLHACWSIPIISKEKLLGTFAMYYHRPHVPTEKDRKIVDFAIRTASLAIERKKAEDALTKSEARFRALVMATSDIIYQMSPDWSVMRRLAGRNFLTDTNQPTANWLQKYIPQDDHEMLTRAVEDAIRKKAVFKLEHRVLLANGGFGWTFSRAIPIFNNDGEIVEWFGAATDVTERKRTEEALRVARDESEKRKRLYEAVTGSTPDLIYVFDLNYKFTYANEALLKMWGKTWDEAIGQTLLPLGYEPWHAEMHEREIDEVVRTKKPVRGEVSFPHATLGRRLYDYILVPVFNSSGDVEAVAGTTRDITDLKRTEEALRESEAKFRRFYESNMLPIAFWHIAGNVYESNEAFAQLVGYTQDEILTGRFSWRTSTVPEHLHLHEQGMQHAIDHEVFVDPYEVDLIRKDGKRINVVIGYAMLEGSREKGVAFLLDISEQKSLLNELETRVEERTKELQRSNEDLQQFAHVASHDLKEPVRKIKTFGYLLQDDATVQSNEKSKLYLDKILTSAERMSTMIEGVLKYSTFSAAEQKVELLDLNRILSDIENDLEVLIQQKRATIIYQDLPRIEGVKVLIYQLFYNLINNSLKFAKPDQPPVVSITSTVVLMDGAEYAGIVVADNGIGFDPSYNHKIFETFIRLHPKHQYDGTGLGLSLCKKIVDRHHGTIEANGRKDIGAVFTIRLPVRQEGSALTR